jgi:hypothetical protein
VEDHDQETEMAVPTLSEALEAVGTVNRFYEARSENTKIISEIGENRGRFREAVLDRTRAEEDNRFLRLNLRKFVILLYGSCSISYFNKFNFQEMSLKL